MNIGIDIGGTYIRAIALPSTRPAASAVRLAVRSAVRQNTPRTARALENTIENMVLGLSGGEKIYSIGAGLPGVLDYKRGVLVHTESLPRITHWRAKKFLSRFNTHVIIDNDSRCFVRAEAKFGAGVGYKNIAGIAIGTGIGGGIIINNKMHYGANMRAGESGHMVLKLGTMNKELRTPLSRSRRTENKKLMTFQELGAKGAFQKHGDRSRIIGVGIANIIHVLDPEIIILGGGGGLSRHVDLPQVRKATNACLRSHLMGKTPIVKGVLGEYAGAIGAAILSAENK